MRLGATIADYGDFTDPEVYLAECLKRGYRCAPCPDVSISETEKIRTIQEKFARADVVVAEFDAWVNPLDLRPEKRRQNRKTIAETLAVADEVGAVCCATVVGAFSTDDEVGHVSPHPDNFAPGAFDAVVEWVRKMLAEVNPRRTKLTLEMSPWTFLNGPDVYLKFIKAVDDPRLAAHLDPANAILDPQLYFSTTKLVNRCFDILGPWIVSCHAKDVIQDHQPNMVTLHEVLPGRGVLDYRAYIRRMEQASPDMPLIIEHLEKEQDYDEAARFIRGVAHEVGATV